MYVIKNEFLSNTLKGKLKASTIINFCTTKNSITKMGNAATAIGDNLTCFRKHENQGAVMSGAGKMGMGRDLDDAVLAATNKTLENNAGLVNVVSLTFACEDLPNLDTFTRTDGMVVLYQKNG